MNSCDRISDERYRAFIEQVSDGVYETDIYGNFTYFNNSLCKVFGYPREEIQGQNFSKFMDSLHARMAYEAFTKIWVTHKGFSDLMWEIIGKDNEVRMIELSAHLITDHKGKKTGFRGIARDVTQKYKTIEALKESELRYQDEYEASRRAEKWARNLLDFVPYPMVVSSRGGKVTYLNPAFTRVFGWTLDELKGKHIPYVPQELKQETEELINDLLKEKMGQLETKRLTKYGKIIDVIITGVVYSGEEDDNVGEVVILRDITQEKRLERNNESLLRISMALPSYPVLEDLMDYISEEIASLLNTEGALVMLLDEEKQEIFFQGAAYDDSTAQKQVKKVRFPAGEGVSGRVIKTGRPAIVHDTSKEPEFFPVVDEQVNVKTENMLIVPLRSSDRIIGVLNAVNKKDGTFDNTDLELLSMVAGTVVLSIENARFSHEIKEAYKEVSSLNRAKDKVINHLSHELKTPVSVLLASLNIFAKKMESLPEETLKPTLERARRNLERILDIQYEVEDIMRDREYRAYHLISFLLEECADEIEALVAEEIGEGQIIQRIRNRIEELFGPKESEITEIDLGAHWRNRLEYLRPKFSHRRVEIVEDIEESPPICIPSEVLDKVIDGLIRNGIENSPDEGKIELSVRKKGEGTELVVRDYGVGITEDDQRRIFEGFFTTRETMDYSSKHPYDFNAGGKGADLLRTKIFSERYNFKIDMDSSRCRYIPRESDICPGEISACDFCGRKEDCHNSGGTTFTLFFPSVKEDSE
ncbi:PAS domain S-box protein [Thermodesulfobacteriota bacterium]